MSLHKPKDDLVEVKQDDSADYGLEKSKSQINGFVPEILQRYSNEELAAMEKRLVRRLDLRCLPILIILFLLNILDRNAIANARLGGLEETLGLSDRQYQTAVMMVWGK
jgi:hypothetical protein